MKSISSTIIDSSPNSFVVRNTFCNKDGYCITSDGMANKNDVGSDDIKLIRNAAIQDSLEQIENLQNMNNKLIATLLPKLESTKCLATDSKNSDFIEATAKPAFRGKKDNNSMISESQKTFLSDLAIEHGEPIEDITQRVYKKNLDSLDYHESNRLIRMLNNKK